MNILGVSCYYHDAGAALLQDGRIIAATEEERFTRVKHDSGFPSRSIAFCLQQAGIRSQDLDLVVFYEKPLVKFERILTTSMATFPRAWRPFRDAMAVWFDEKLWIKNRLMRMLGLPPDKVLFIDHHLSHAASAFLCSPFREAAILTVDGIGEWTTATMGRGAAAWEAPGSNQITLTHEMRFPHSLGLLYSAFTAFLGFEVNEGEYKVMGMAPYGEPRYLDKLHRVAEVAEDGSLHLRMEYFSFHHSTTEPFSPRFLDLFGTPRDAACDFVTARTNGHGTASSDVLQRNQYFADIAASVQRFTEDVLLKMANHLHRSTGSKCLCLAGGVALNSVANGRILRETPFEELFIPPAPGDSGGALGAALYAWHILLGKPRQYTMENAYLGQQFGEGEVADFLHANGIRHEHFADTEKLCSVVADELVQGRVLGWFQGRFEWGPRALGNRSILADPRRGDMKQIVNSKIKFREPFRPFAPAVLEDKVADFVDAPYDLGQCYPARFMLLVVPWKGEAGRAVPAVSHMGTARLQTVRRDWNPLYHQVIDNFGQATGIPVVLNTSFNLRGEPIVASPADAWNTFSKSGLDSLVLGNCVVRKPL